MAGAFMTESVYGNVLQGRFPYLSRLSKSPYDQQTRTVSDSTAATANLSSICTHTHRGYRQKSVWLPETDLPELVKRTYNHYHPLRTLETGRVSVLLHQP